jgi:hypothetical protein
LKRLDEYFSEARGRRPHMPAIVAFLEVGRFSMKTYNKRRGIERAAGSWPKPSGAPHKSSSALESSSPIATFLWIGPQPS